jgi:hypothetical protein
MLAKGYMKGKYNEENIRKIVLESKSITQVILTLGLKNAGGSASTIKKYINKYNLDTSHFTGSVWNKGKTFPAKIPLEDYLSNKIGIQTNKLRVRLLKDGIFSHECSMCHNSVWNDKPIPIELDHINGNKIDNSLNNLRLLCPNCHAQTPTYKIKNSKKYKANLYNTIMV